MTPCRLTVVLLVADTPKQTRPYQSHCPERTAINLIPEFASSRLLSHFCQHGRGSWTFDYIVSVSSNEHRYRYIYIYSLSKNINFNDYWHCSEIFCVVFTIQCSQRQRFTVYFSPLVALQWHRIIMFSLSIPYCYCNYNYNCCQNSITVHKFL